MVNDGASDNVSIMITFSSKLKLLFYSEGFVRRLIGGDKVSQKASLNEFKSKRLIPCLQSEAPF